MLPARLAWAEIDLDALAHNYFCIRKAARGARVSCVIKADAYGHGAARLALLYEALGADMLAVASLSEALTVRKAGGRLPLLILGATPPMYAEVLVRERLTQTVYSAAYAEALAEALCGTGGRLGVHIKIESGMHRLGLRPEECEALIPLLTRTALHAEGIFTHPSHTDAEDGGAHAVAQYAALMAAEERLRAAGIPLPIRHISNSAAIFEHPEMRLDMVRAGLALYGISPAGAREELRPALTLRAAVVATHRLSAGESVGYGGTFTAERMTQVATLPIGYADGIDRCAAAHGMTVEIRGAHAPVIGRVCMDMTMLDVTDTGAAIGDTVTIYGKEAPVSVAAFAARSGKTPYELLCAIGKRVPREYVTN